MARTAARTSQTPKTVFTLPASAASNSTDVATGYPSLRAAAAMIGVNVSTLSRQQGLRVVQAGQEKRVPADEIIRLAAQYKRRGLSRVAGMITEHAFGTAPEALPAIRNEVHDALRTYRPTTDSSDDARQFLADARKYLPGPLADQVERSLAARAAFDEPPAGIDAVLPDDD